MALMTHTLSYNCVSVKLHNLWKCSKRFELPEEVAAVVAFIASTESAVIHGAAVRADGGVIRSIF